MATSISLVNTLNLEQRAELLRYAKDCAERISMNSLSDFRALLRYRDRAYQRQLNTTAEHIKAVRANMAGDARKLQDMTVPIIMPQIESAVAYQAGVYLTSHPIFGVVSYPANQNQALQFETALADQSSADRRNGCCALSCARWNAAPQRCGDLHRTDRVCRDGAHGRAGLPQW